MEEKMIQKMNAVVSVVFVVAALILFGVAFKNRASSERTSSSNAPAMVPPVAEAQPYQDLAGMKHVELAKDFSSWTPDSKVEPEKTRSASLAVSGTIAKAYLTVKASLEGKPLTAYESIYLKLNDVGGHLFRPKSLQTPETGMTSLLFPLNGVPVLPNVPYDESRVSQDADLLALLQNGKSVKLTAFISSLRPALLEELSIAYVCAEASECGLSLK